MSTGDSGYGSRNHKRNMNRDRAMAQPTMNNNNTTFSATKIDQQSQPLQYNQYPFPDQSYREPYGTSVSAVEESLPDSSFLTETPSDEVHQQDFHSVSNPPAIDLAGLGLDQGNPFDMFPMNLESTHPMTPNTPPFPVDHDFSILFGNDIPWNALPRDDSIMPNQPQKYSKTPRNKRRRVESDSGIDTQQSSTPSAFNQSRSEMQPHPARYNTSLHPLTARSVQQDHMNSPYPQEQQPEATSFSASARRNTSPSLSQQSPSQPSQKAQRKSTERHTCDKCHSSFSTINDLDRHRKGVHQFIKPGESIWRCKISGCTQADKIWPRKDNFLQHLKRMHFTAYESKAADAKAHEVVDKYEEKYDVQKHGLPAGSTRGGPRSRPTQESSSPARVHKRASVSGTPMIQQPFILDTASQGLDMSSQYPCGMGLTRSKRPNSSMINNDDWTNANTSSIGASFTPARSQYLQPPQSGGMGRTMGRSWDSQTVPPNVGSRLRQQQEIREHDRAVPVVSRNVPEDLSSIGLGLEPIITVNPSLLSNTSTRTINPDPTSAVQISGPDPEKAIDEVLKNLSPETKDILRSLPPGTRAIFFEKVEKVEESHQGQDSSDRSVPKPSMKKQADGEKKLKCNQLVEKKGEKGEKEKSLIRCPASFNSPSELRKHSKRHEKRFGCTFDRCYSKFGTKWEWKRHEQNQHIQHEAWRCRYTDGKTSCQKLFGSQKKFEEHLVQSHFWESGTEGFKKEVEQCHLLKKWLGSFWCGYCQDIVQCTKDYGRDMDDERVEHIGLHVEQGLKSEDWIELAAEGRTKREMKVIKDAGFRLVSHSTKLESREQSSRQETEDEDEDDDEGNDSDGTEAGEFDDSNSPAELQQSRAKLPKLDVHAAQNTSLPPSSQGSHTPLPNTPSRIQVYTPENLLLADHMLDDVNTRPMQQRRAYTDNDTTDYQYQHQHQHQHYQSQSQSLSYSQPQLQSQPQPQLQQIHTLPRECCQCGRLSIYQHKCQLPDCRHECGSHCFQMSPDSFGPGGFPNDDAVFGYYGDTRMMGYS